MFYVVYVNHPINKAIVHSTLCGKYTNRRRDKTINGYYKENHILNNSVINFVGETINAFVLRHWRKPIANQSKFITNRLKHSENSIMKTVLKNPLFLYSARLATIRTLWRLEKFAINQAIS